MGFGVSGEMKSTISQHLTPSTMNNIHKKKEMTTKQRLMMVKIEIIQEIIRDPFTILR